MNAVGVRGKSFRHNEFDFKEEVKYLDREMVGFHPIKKGPIKTLSTGARE